MQAQPLELSPANKYRDLAVQCSAFSTAAGRPEAKATWMGLAMKWERLAKEAEKRASEQPQAKEPGEARATAGAVIVR